jgi:hypothetical protein
VLVEAAISTIPKILKGRKSVLVAVGVLGVAAAGAAAKGAADLHRGRSVKRGASTRLEEAIAKFEAARELTVVTVSQYGEFQIKVHGGTVGRFADWLEVNQHLVKRLNFKKVDGVRIRVPNIPTYVSNVESVSAGLSGIVAGFGAGAAAKAGALWGVSSFASASTGTAITSLSGVAAENAVLAWLGGGAVAAGGGGVAAGGAVLTLVTVVPALVIGSMTVGVVGAKHKTKSLQFVASVEEEIARIELVIGLLSAIDNRIDELRELLGRLTKRATVSLAVLESFDFDPELHASEFLQALQLVTAIKEVLETPILDPKSGELTEASIEIVRKYT